MDLQRAAGNRATTKLLVAQRFGEDFATAGPPVSFAGSMVITGVIGTAEGGTLVTLAVEGVAATLASPVVIGLAVVGAVGVMVYLTWNDWQRFAGATAAPPLAPPNTRLPDSPRVPRAIPRPTSFTPGNTVGPIVATLGAGVTLAQIRQQVTVSTQTRGRNCVPPNPAPLAAWVLGRALVDLPVNLTRFWASRGPVPQTTAAVRRDRRNFLLALHQTMNCAMVAAKCDGEIIGYAEGNKRIGDRSHAEELALPVIRQQLRARSRQELTGATLLSVCESVPCNGRWAGKNCDRMLRNYWHGKSYGGGVTGMATGWPPGYDDAANTTYNAAWEVLCQTSMGTAMRTPLP